MIVHALHRVSFCEFWLVGFMYVMSITRILTVVWWGWGWGWGWGFFWGLCYAQ